MSVKSTIELTRMEAVSRAADLHQQMERRKIEAFYFVMENEELAEKLEIMNDNAHKGEGFENYRITD